ncbi:hypothetical protein ACQRWP_15375 [Micromonospora trifolii]|uniref:hypothetical protein n=1 Tax=Micromonospora trifolii TaxID=2911208 RepID=UPI003D2EFCAE
MTVAQRQAQLIAPPLKRDGRYLLPAGHDLDTFRERIMTQREITRQGWATHLPSERYDPSCGAPLSR